MKPIVVSEDGPTAAEFLAPMNGSRAIPPLPSSADGRLPTVVSNIDVLPAFQLVNDIERTSSSPAQPFDSYRASKMWLVRMRWSLRLDLPRTGHSMNGNGIDEGVANSARARGGGWLWNRGGVGSGRVRAPGLHSHMHVRHGGRDDIIGRWDACRYRDGGFKRKKARMCGLPKYIVLVRHCGEDRANFCFLNWPWLLPTTNMY